MLEKLDRIVDNLQGKIYDFSHPDVNQDLTIVSYQADDLVLTAELFSTKGEPIFEQFSRLSLQLHGFELNLRNNGDELHVRRVYVDPEHYGKRIGTQLVKCVLATARQSGVKTVTLKADPYTNAMSYWRIQHGFESPNPRKREMMVKTWM